jgi:hypothetical protein
MPSFTSSNLKEMSYEDLFQMFVNAVGLIAKEKQVEAAKAMIVAIQKEWERRRNLGDAFTDFDRPEVGMLAALGYRVGHTEGKPRLGHSSVTESSSDFYRTTLKVINQSQT